MTRTKLCLVGDSSSIHVKRWAEHFSKDNDVMVVSDSSGEIAGVHVNKVFEGRAGARNLFGIPRMRRLVRAFGPDIVHGHYLTVGGFYAAFSGGSRIVGSAWGSDVYYGPERSLKERTILRSVLRRCDLVFAGTREMAGRVKGYGYDGELLIFRWGADEQVFRRTARHGTGEFRILSIRPCDRIYNPMVVLNAFRTVMSEMKDAYLYMPDFGALAGMVRETVESEPSLAARVRMLPQTPYAQMPALYNSADVAVSVPNSDSAAASVLEAMACELPVIATDIPNMREWVEEGVNGHLTAIDASVLASKLRAAYAERERLPEMGRRAREKVLDERNQGTFSANIKVAEGAYRRLLEHKGSAL